MVPGSWAAPRPYQGHLNTHAYLDPKHVYSYGLFGLVVEVLGKSSTNCWVKVGTRFAEFRNPKNPKNPNTLAQSLLRGASSKSPAICNPLNSSLAGMGY